MLNNSTSTSSTSTSSSSSSSSSTTALIHYTSNPTLLDDHHHPSSSSSSSSLNFNLNLNNHHDNLHDHHHDDHRKRKRNRTMQSCLPCHTNKRKCNRGRPCERCTNLGTTGNCVYETEDPDFHKKNDENDPAWQVHRLRKRIAELEGVVRQLKGRPDPKKNISSSNPSQTTSFPREQWSSVSSIEILPSTCRSSSSTGSLPPSPSLDLSPGGGLSQRRASCPPDYCEDRTVFQDDDDGPKVFLGNVSGGGLLRKLNGLTSPNLRSRTLHTQTFSSSNEKTDLITAQAAYRGLFGGTKRWAFDIPWGNGPKDIVEFLNAILMTRDNALELLDIFLDEVDCFYHGWHTPTVVSYYKEFFNLSLQEQRKFPTNKLSVIVAIITVTIDISPHIIGHQNFNQKYKSEPSYRQELKDWRSANSQLLASLTVDCLKKASYLGHPSLECIQAQLILLLYMVNNGRCTDAWCFAGGFIKQAQCLGLHIDPEDLDPSLPLLDKEVRRRIWWAIQTWDTSLSIAFGWPTGVTTSDTDLPKDRTEESLFGSSPVAADPVLPEPGITDLTYHVYNWEAYQYAHLMMDKIFHQTRWRWRSQDRKDPKPSYDEIEELDKTIRTWYKRIPVNMRFEPELVSLKSTPNVIPDLSCFVDLSDINPSSSCVSAQDIRNRNPVWAKQSLMLAISQNAILLLLHRPFIGQSNDRSPDRPVNQTLRRHQLRSEVKCLRSSQVIIEAQGLLAELFPTTHRMWYGWYKTFHAAMTSAWISQLHPKDHPIFQVGERCLELATKAFEIGIVNQNEPSDPNPQVQDHHLSACNQLKAVWKFIISRDADSKAITISNVWSTLGVPHDFPSYPPSSNSKVEWLSPSRPLFMSPMSQTQSDLNFTSSTAGCFGPLRPPPPVLHQTYSQYPGHSYNNSSPISPEHSLSSPRALHPPSTPSVHESSEPARNSSVQHDQQQQQQQHNSSTETSNSGSIPFNHSFYSSHLSHNQTLDHQHRHHLQSPFAPEPHHLGFKTFLPPASTIIYGPSHSQQTLYTSPHSFSSLPYHDLNSQMSSMLMLPSGNRSNDVGAQQPSERLHIYPTSSVELGTRNPNTTTTTPTNINSSSSNASGGNSISNRPLESTSKPHRHLHSTTNKNHSQYL